MQFRRRHIDQKALEEARRIVAEQQPRAKHTSRAHEIAPATDDDLQQQCLLVCMLPPEIRQRIWGYVLACIGRKIERWRPAEQLAKWEGSMIDADCFPYRLTSAGCNSVAHPLGLLLTCRQFYHEVSHILYSTTEFIFTEPQDLVCWQDTLPSEHLNSITRLQIACRTASTNRKQPEVRPRGVLDYKTDEVTFKAWKSMFDRLSSATMASLRHLEVWLYSFTTYDQAARPTDMLRRLSDLQSQRHDDFFKFMNGAKVPVYHLYLDWWPQDVFDALGQLSFKPYYKPEIAISAHLYNLPRGPESQLREKVHDLRLEEQVKREEK